MSQPKEEASSPMASGSDTERDDTIVEKGAVPITHHYLTFDTILPQPTDLSVIENVPAPNLKRYRDPFTWPNSQKNILILLCCVSTMLTAYCAGMYSPAVPQMMEEWGTSRVVTYLGIAIFTAGKSHCYCLPYFSAVSETLQALLYHQWCWLLSVKLTADDQSLSLAEFYL